MATTKVDINLISATGTASSSTFLRGDSAWAAAAGGWAFVSTQSVSAVSTVSVTGIDNSAALWVWVFEGVNVATDNTNPYLRTSNDTSSHSYDSGGSDYSWSVGGHFNTTYYSALDEADSEIHLGDSVYDTGNDATTGISGIIYIHNPSDTTYFTGITYNWHNMNTDTATQNVQGSGQREAAEAVDALQFYMSSGNVDSGRFTLYKVVHA